MADRSTTHHTITHVVAQTLRTYEKDAEIFLQQWGRKKYKRPGLLREWMALLPRSAMVLDLGCGAGQDARYLTTLGHRVVGLDRTMPLLRFARQRSSSVPFVLADMRALPIRVSALDGIWAAASLMHVPKSVARLVLSELRERTQPNGMLAATVTHGVKSRIKTRGWMPGRYFARWKKDELAKALHRTGWQVLALSVVGNQERKGRWINVIARPKSALTA